MRRKLSGNDWTSASGNAETAYVVCGRTRPLWVNGCISMLRYWSSRRYSTLRTCFVGRRLFIVNQLPPTRSQFRLLCWCGLSMRGVSVIPSAVSLRVSISQSTGILGIPLPALLSNIRLSQARERVSTKGFVVLMTGNAKSNHVGAQGTLKRTAISIHLSS